MRAMLFSPQMAPRVHEGAKDVTRRPICSVGIDGPIRLKLDERGALMSYVADIMGVADDHPDAWTPVLHPVNGCETLVRCPYTIGQRCFVAEEHYRFGHWEPVAGVRTRGGRQKWAFVADSDEVRFEAPEWFRKGRHHQTPDYKAWHKRMARFMPAALARAEVEIVSVRPERVQDITEADALREGVPCEPIFDTDRGINGQTFPVREFQWIWNSIYGPESWTRNDWVWRIEFTLHRRAGR